MTLGQIWYYMIYLSDDNFIKFWGLIEYSANTKYLLFLYFAITIATIVVTMIAFTYFTKVRKGLSFFIGAILTIFVFQAIVSKSAEIRTQVTAQAEQLYKEAPSKFKDWDEHLR